VRPPGERLSSAKQRRVKAAERNPPWTAQKCALRLRRSACRGRAFASGAAGAGGRGGLPPASLTGTPRTAATPRASQSMTAPVTAPRTQTADKAARARQTLLPVCGSGRGVSC
jgi:hypothetical protein